MSFHFRDKDVVWDSVKCFAVIQLDLNWAVLEVSTSWGKENEKTSISASKPVEVLKRIAKGIARQSEEYYALLKTKGTKMVIQLGPPLSAFG